MEPMESSEIDKKTGLPYDELFKEYDRLEEIFADRNLEKIIELTKDKNLIPYSNTIISYFSFCRVNFTANDKKILDYLIDNSRIDLSYDDNEPIKTAAFATAKYMNYILKKGVNINIIIFKLTFLPSNARTYKLNKFLIRKGADINAYDDSSKCLFSLFCLETHNKHIKEVKFFMKKGANIFANQCSALADALYESDRDIKYNDDYFYDACCVRNSERVLKVLKRKQGNNFASLIPMM